MDEASRSEPVRPFEIARAPVNQIAGVKNEPRIRRTLEGSPNDTGPLRGQPVLRIAQIDEAQGAGPRRRAGLQPLAPPALAPLHAIGIERVGLEPVKPNRMVARCRKVTVVLDRQGHAGMGEMGESETLRLCCDRHCGLVEAGIRQGLGDFRLGRLHRACRTPADANRGCGIAVHRRDDPVGPFGGLLPRHLDGAMLAIMRGGKSRRAQRDDCDEERDSFHL